MDTATKYPYRLRLSNLQASVRRESDARLYQTQHLKEIAACPRPTFRSFDYVKWRSTKVFESELEPKALQALQREGQISSIVSWNARSLLIRVER